MLPKTFQWSWLLAHNFPLDLVTDGNVDQSILVVMVNEDDVLQTFPVEMVTNINVDHRFTVELATDGDVVWFMHYHADSYFLCSERSAVLLDWQAMVS